MEKKVFNSSHSDPSRPSFQKVPTEEEAHISDAPNGPESPSAKPVASTPSEPRRFSVGAPVVPVVSRSTLQVPGATGFNKQLSTKHEEDEEEEDALSVIASEASVDDLTSERGNDGLRASTSSVRDRSPHRTSTAPGAVTRAESEAHARRDRRSTTLQTGRVSSSPAGRATGIENAADDSLRPNMEIRRSQRGEGDSGTDSLALRSRQPSFGGISMDAGALPTVQMIRAMSSQNNNRNTTGGNRNTTAETKPTVRNTEHGTQGTKKSTANADREIKTKPRTLDFSSGGSDPQSPKREAPFKSTLSTEGFKAQNADFEGKRPAGGSTRGSVLGQVTDLFKRPSGNFVKKLENDPGETSEPSAFKRSRTDPDKRCSNSRQDEDDITARTGSTQLSKMNSLPATGSTQLNVDGWGDQSMQSVEFNAEEQMHSRGCGTESRDTLGPLTDTKDRQSHMSDSFGCTVTDTIVGNAMKNGSKPKAAKKSAIKLNGRSFSRLTVESVPSMNWLRKSAAHIRKTLEVPEQLLDSDVGLFGLLCPSFVPALESRFQAFQAERLRNTTHGYLHLFGLWTASLTMLIINLTTLIRSGADLSLGADNDALLTIVLSSIFVILVSSWVCIFLSKADEYGDKASKDLFAARRAMRMRWLSCLTVIFFVSWQCFLEMHSIADALTRSVRMMVLFIAWASMPGMVPLKWMLFAIHLAVTSWSCMVVLAELEAPWSIVEHAAYLYGFGLILFVLVRRSTLDLRAAYVGDHLANQAFRHDAKTIANLADEVKQLGSFLPSEEFFKSLMKAHQERLKALRGDLENSEAKMRMKMMHYSLISTYVSLAHQTDLEDGKAFDSLVEEFEALKHESETESLRLAEMMQQLYSSFCQLDEWPLIQACPTFDNVARDPERPKEKLCQPSKCEWWDHDPAQFPVAQERVGLIDDRMSWYTIRAQWCRTTFAGLLRGAVVEFNNAETPLDLGMDPEDIMAFWNENHPESELKELPFPDTTQLTSDMVQMSATMQHEYLEHGRHCGLQVGPIKDRVRAMAKVQEYTEADPEQYPDRDCLEKYVCDMLRARVVFASPKALAIFYWYLLVKIPKLKIVISKNKLTKSPETDTSCNIHLNVRFETQGEEHVAEVQLMLESFVVAKDLEHKYYEFRRATRLSEILAPVLESAEPEAIPPTFELTSSKSLMGSRGLGSKPDSKGLQRVTINVEHVATNGPRTQAFSPVQTGEESDVLS